ncbi:MAG: hypothetical protein ACLTZB_05905 [Streptococcus salivarius]
MEDGSLTTGNCLYFSQKNAEFYTFLILFLILSCLYFCFSLMQVGGGMKAQIRKSSGASFALVSKERGSAFSWKEGQRLVIYLM